MKNRKVTQYECDFCKKRGLSAGHMKKHESRCTMNPDRDCGVCMIVEGGNVTDLKAAMAILPDPTEYPNPEEPKSGLDVAVKAVWDSFKTECNNCPACMLAALRQKKIHPQATFGMWDFKKEMVDTYKELIAITNEHY